MNVYYPWAVQMYHKLSQCMQDPPMLEDSLYHILVDPQKQAAARQLLQLLENRDSLDDADFESQPESYFKRVLENNHESLEMLGKIYNPMLTDFLDSSFHAYAGLRIAQNAYQTHTPYWIHELAELETWKQQQPEEYYRLNAAAFARFNREYPHLNKQVIQWGSNAYMVSARKLRLSLTNVREIFQGTNEVISWSQGRDQERLYIGVGRPLPGVYEPLGEEAGKKFQNHLSPANHVWANLKNKLHPWSSPKVLQQWMPVECMVYLENHFNSLSGCLESSSFQKWLVNPKKHPCPWKTEEFQQHALRLTQMMSSEQKERMHKIFSGAFCLQWLLHQDVVRPATQYVMHQWSKQAVERWAASQGLSDKPQHFKDQCLVNNLRQYAIQLETVPLPKLRKMPFFKNQFEDFLLQHLPEKERQKNLASFKPIALVASWENRQTPEDVPPADCAVMRTYQDAVTNKTWKDYALKLPEGNAIICLAEDGSWNKGVALARKLLQLNTVTHQDPQEKIMGTCLSEGFHQELRKSCLHHINIIRSGIYTEFLAKNICQKIQGSLKTPANEMIIESLRPAGIFKYNDRYQRVKPAEMVRVKYRTPAGEKENPCWDASQAAGCLSPENVAERQQDVKWSLILVEGEKKALFLAQMALDMRMPYHVISLPGVWMAMKTNHKNQRELIKELQKWMYADQQGNKRRVYVLFDNDKRYKLQVYMALLETAKQFLKHGAQVFAPDLPFGAHCKGVDDFAYNCCQRDRRLSYKPLLNILQNAPELKEPLPKIKQPNPADQRVINDLLGKAELLDAAQSRLALQAHPNNQDGRKLWEMQKEWLCTQNIQTNWDEWINDPLWREHPIMRTNPYLILLDSLIKKHVQTISWPKTIENVVQENTTIPQNMTLVLA